MGRRERAGGRKARAARFRDPDARTRAGVGAWRPRVADLRSGGLPLRALGARRRGTVALRVGFRAGERVDAVVFGVAAVALDPMPLDPVAGDRVEQLLPQLGVLDRLPVRGPPAVALPAVDPAG